MKKTVLALMCMASFIMMTACGGGSKKSAEDNVVKALEEAFETGAFGDRTKEAAQAAFKSIKLTLADVEPGYAYIDVDTVKIYRGVVYRGTNQAIVAYIKADRTDASREEFEVYVRKIYAVTQKIADGGKVIYGFEKKSTVEEAESEWAVDDILAQNILGFPLNSYDWGFKQDGKFKRMEVSLLDANKKYPTRLEINFYDALQKSMSDTMKDAEKALENPEVQKALENLKKK